VGLCSITVSFSVRFPRNQHRKVTLKGGGRVYSLGNFGGAILNEI